MKRHFRNYVMKQYIVYVAASFILTLIAWFVSPKMNQKIAMTVLFGIYFLFNLIRMCLAMIKASSAFEKDEEMDGYCIENAVLTEKEIIAWYHHCICRIRYSKIKEALHDGNLYQHIKLQMKGRSTVSVVSEDTRLKIYTKNAECADVIMNLIGTKNPFAQLKYKSSENQTVQLSELKKYQ